MNCCLCFIVFFFVFCVVFLLYVSEVEVIIDVVVIGVECLLIELVVVCVQVGKLKVDILCVNVFGGGLWKDMLVLVNVFECDYFDCCQLCLLFELVSNDVLLGDVYVLVGYYQNVVIRGFVLDVVIGYCFNGLFIVGE